MDAPISDLYERYKIGTKRVVQWLAETAGKTGHNDNSKIVTVSTNEITELAEFILKATTPDSAAPKDIESIIRILEDVIAGRRECAVWYKHKTAEHERDEEFERSQKGHQHFVDALRTVLGRLRDVFQIGLKSGKSGKQKILLKAVDTEDVTRNIYEGLAIEEPSMDFLAAAAADLETRQISQAPDGMAPAVPAAKKKSKKKRKKASQKSTIFELESQQEDEDFALWCLLKDCHLIRLHVRKLWQSYSAGAVGLQTAAIVTDKAFLLIKHAVAEFTNDFPALSTMEQVAVLLNIDASLKGQTLESFQYKGSNDASSEADAVELLCVPALLHLVVLRRSIMRPGTAEEQWEEQRYRETSHKLVRMADALAMEPGIRPTEFLDFLDLTASDPFTFELFGALTTDSVAADFSLQIVIGFQMHMDLVEIVDKITWAPFQAILLTKEHLQQRIWAFERVLASIRPDGYAQPKQWTANRDNCKKVMTEGLENYAHLRRDYDEAKDPVAGLLDMSWVVTFPVFGGKLISDLITQMYLDGLAACNEGCIVLSMAHIYRACRTSGLLKRAWKDMDTFISLARPENLKLPPPGFSFAALLTSAQHYRTALGMHVQPHQVTEKGSEPRSHVRDPLPTLDYMAEHSTYTPARAVLYYDHREAANNQTQRHQPEEYAARDALFHVARTIMTRQNTTASPEMQARWTSCGKLTPTDLLTLFQGEMESEEEMLHFNYHGLMGICLRMLTEIKLNPKLAIHRKLPENCSFAQLTDEVLWEAQEVGTLNMRRGTSTALHVAALCIDQIVSRQGDGAIVFDNSCLNLPGILRNDPKTDFSEAIPQWKPAYDASDFPSVSLAGRKIELQKGARMSTPERDRFVRACKMAENYEAGGMSMIDAWRAARKVVDSHEEESHSDPLLGPE